MKQAREVAFVTGAGSGIGRATALRLARRGAALGVFDINEAAVKETSEMIEAAGGEALYVVGSVSDDASVCAAVATTVRRLGSLCTAVACAGIEATGTVVSTSLADWQRVLDVNVTGTFLTARHTIPALVANGGGAFVAVSSDAGLGGWQGFAAYCASKHAVIGLVRCLAVDHGCEGVRSSCVCPAFVETPMGDRLMSGDEERDFYKGMIPLGRFAQPEEVAEAIAHLSSPEASFTNGLLYALDGGETAGFYRAG